MNLTLVSQTNLTPKSEQPAFLAKFQATETLDYQPGDWVTLQAINQPDLVAQVIEVLNLDPQASVQLRRAGEVSVQDALQNHLELTLLDPSILNKLVRQFGFDAWQDRQQMKDYAQGKDILDLISDFPAVKQLGLELLQVLVPLVPRYYSIASNSNSDNTVDVIYKAIKFSAQGRDRKGVTSSFLQGIMPGDLVQAEIKANPQFKLPADPATQIIMFGAGTGLAPFMGFMQARFAQNAKNNWLFFGETERATRFLCEAELTAWQEQGFLRLDTAFSRDQAEKVYVQDLLKTHNQAWLQAYESGAITYVCGDRDGMGAGVEQVIKQTWQQAYGWDDQQAQTAWQDARKQGKIQLDIY